MLLVIYTRKNVVESIKSANNAMIGINLLNFNSNVVQTNIRVIAIIYNVLSFNSIAVD